MIPPSLVLLIGGLAMLVVGALFVILGDRNVKAVGFGLVSAAIAELGVKVGKIASS